MTRLVKYFEELTHLRAVIEQGSINRAAPRLGISQPALTRSIKRLEHYLKVRLIDRTPRGVLPTPFGEALLNHIRSIDSELARAIASVEALKGGNVGMIRCGGTLGSLNWLLPTALTELQQSRPSISAQVSEGIPAILTAMLRLGELDVAVFTNFDDLHEPDMVSHTIGFDHIDLFARTQHPLHSEPHKSLSDLAKSERWVVPFPTSALYNRIRAEFNRLNIDMPTKVVETSSYVMLSAMLRTTDHVVITTAQTLGHELTEGSVSAIRSDWNRLKTRIVAYRRSDATPSPATMTLIKILQRVARQQRSASRK